MKVSYFPGRESNYARTAVFIRSMKEAGLDIIDCSYHRKVWFRYVISLMRFLRGKDRADIIIVGFCGQILMPITRFITSKRIIFDAYISLYDTLCYDRKRIHPQSILGKMLFWLDKYSCEIADFVLLDTNEHIKYFHNTFGIPLQKMARVFIGADTSIFSPDIDKNMIKKDNSFIVGFDGSFLPLHGVDYILRSAEILLKNGHRDIRFDIVGNGQTFKDCLKYAIEHKLRNVKFHGKKPLNEIPRYIARSDIYLGIFGNTEKAKRVIPTKIYQCLAMKKPIITADTPAIRELLQNRENVFLCDSSNPHSLGKCILELKNNPKIRDEIVGNAYKTFLDRCSESVIGNQLNSLIEETKNRENVYHKVLLLKTLPY